MKFFTLIMKLLILMPTVLASDSYNPLSREYFGCSRKKQPKMITREQFNQKQSTYSSYSLYRTKKKSKKQSDTSHTFPIYPYVHESNEYSIKNQMEPLKADTKSKFQIYSYDHDLRKYVIKNKVEDTDGIIFIREDGDSIMTKIKKNSFLIQYR